MNEIKQQTFTGERALFTSVGLDIHNCVFEDGESPLKHSRDIKVTDSAFRWRYPLWYCSDIEMRNCTFSEDVRAGLWYTENLRINKATIESPKNIRRCSNVELQDVRFTNGPETLWFCDHIMMKDIYVKGDYFAMNSNNIRAEKLRLEGKYSFDGVRNVEISDSKLITKDAFWNSENVTVYNSFISAEYLGWNSKNLTFINCTIESLQGLCYVDNLVMKNCRTLNTTLAFEYSNCDVEIAGHVDSIKNPSSGVIRVGSIGELIMERERVNPDATEIILTAN